MRKGKQCMRRIGKEGEIIHDEDKRTGGGGVARMRSKREMGSKR